MEVLNFPRFEFATVLAILHQITDTSHLIAHNHSPGGVQDLQPLRYRPSCQAVDEDSMDTHKETSFFSTNRKQLGADHTQAWKPAVRPYLAKAIACTP